MELILTLVARSVSLTYWLMENREETSNTTGGKQEFYH